jgi:hypothetical protein
MKREYVAVADGDGRYPDSIVKSCVASRRAVAERKMGLPPEQFIVMTKRQAEARGLIDMRDMVQFCRSR